MKDMLHNEIFRFSEITAEDEVVSATVQLNPTHPVFKGHFPGQPVLPGVCMVQMVKELLGMHIQQSTRLSRAGDIKFLSVIVPGQDKKIRIELKISHADDLIKVDASLSDAGTTLFKFRGMFKLV
jgi:3-hydroxyacyl-[acyl-carrier-protein] dehydratase